jgi:hypothetical protein
MPRTLAEQGTTAGDTYLSQRVFYEDLWPGISLTFGLSPKGTCEATYVLVTSADVTKIRLRYNVPVELQQDGTLKFRFSTGSVTESAPEAWQEINGKRVSVAVSFTLVRGEVGFEVGTYDPRFPLTIDPQVWSVAACRRLSSVVPALSEVRIQGGHRPPQFDPIQNGGK